MDNIQLLLVSAAVVLAAGFVILLARVRAARRWQAAWDSYAAQQIAGEWREHRPTGTVSARGVILSYARRPRTGP